MKHEITIPITVTTEQCRDVLTTATDMGGINYWELPFRNRVRDDDLNCISFEVKCIDAPSTGGALGEWTTVDENTVIEGLKQIVEKPDMIAKYIRDGIIEHLGSPQDNGIEMCDLEMADVIIQIGLFGELVYG